MQTVVVKAVEGLRPKAESKGLALIVRVREPFPSLLLADPARIQQIVMNLVGNAIKFTDRGGVEVSLGAESEKGDSVAIEIVVKDSGPGVPPAERDRLFQPFSRLSGTLDREGAGLGLAVAAALCRRLGGHLACDSDCSTGATFRAKLALKRCPGIGLPTLLHRQTIAGTRVLVADDNRLVRELFVAYLSELGAHCDSAVDGAEALAMAKSGRHHVLILDLSMPEMNGYDVARGLRESGSKVRIVGVSAHAGERERTQAFSSGMDDFLTKPVELSALARALELSPPKALPSDSWGELRSRWAREFRREVPKHVSEISSFLDGRNWGSLSRRIHYLKNSALVLGDERLQAALGAFDSAVQAANGTDSDAAWEASKSAIEAWLVLSNEPLPQRNAVDDDSQPATTR